MHRYILSLFALILLGAGCVAPALPSPSVVPNAVQNDQTSQTTGFEFVEDSRYTLLFPERWRGIESYEDFDGYGPQEEFLSYDIPGKSRLFYYEPAGEELLYLFAIMSIDLKDKSKMTNYPTEQFLGSNDVSAFYGGMVSKSGPWSYIYDGRQDTYAEQMKDIDQIFSSFKIK